MSVVTAYRIWVSGDRSERLHGMDQLLHQHGKAIQGKARTSENKSVQLSSAVWSHDSDLIPNMAVV